MRELTDHEDSRLRVYISELTSFFIERRLNVRVRSHFGPLMEFFRASPDRFINQTFDPEMHAIPPAEALWIEVQDAEGTTVTTGAVRNYPAVDFFELVRSQHLWDPGLGPEARTELDLPDDAPAIRGSVNYHGCLWVDRAWRGQDLGQYATQLTYALGFRRFAPDWLCSIMRTSLSRSPMSSLCRFERIIPLLDRDTAMTGPGTPIDLGYQSRDYLMALVEDHVGRVDADQQPAHAPPVAQAGQR